MEDQNFKSRIEALKAKINVEDLKKRADEIEKEMGNPCFWQDQNRARKLTQEFAEIKRDLEELEKLEIYLKDGNSLALEKALRNLEIKIFLSGFYDKGDAILAIHAGQGGTEAMDWAEMLERMYIRYAESKNWEVDVVDLTPGEEAGVKSVTMVISGPYAYGYLKNEAGVHRLVRQSPFNADKLRQTSFAKVEVLPMIEESPEIEISDNDLSWEFFRASSQGGQNVQKVSSAVRLRHKPTGIVVTCQSERYQEQNRKIALALLKSKLWSLAKEKAEEEKRKLKGEVKIAGWGNQIRSYILHPYKMVKDLRTGFETSEPEKVLNGEIDGFIDAELRLLVR
jgi:peptide chain release factor 2